jgi:hypothetical protein
VQQDPLVPFGESEHRADLFAAHPLDVTEQHHLALANRNDPAGVTQQVAACPVAAWSSRLTVPLRLRSKVASALVPASAITRWPNGSKEIANGTVPGSLLTVAWPDSRPPKPTPHAGVRC